MTSVTTQQQQNNKKQQQQKVNSIQQFPQSVEEAGALVGATITLCGKQNFTIQSLPDRMHSAFAIVQPIPSQELITRLYNLRSLLRTEEYKRINNNSNNNNSNNNNKQPLPPLAAAQSLLPLLKKLIGISVQLATAAAQQYQQNDVVIKGSSTSTTSTVPVLSRRYETPPLVSTPIRKLWVDCIVACYRLSGDITKNEIITFVQQMLLLAVLNPRTQKAAGGVRIAALDVIGSLLEDTSSDYDLQSYDTIINPNTGLWNKSILVSRSNNNRTSTSLAQQLSPWTYDILNVSLRALRSAGTGEPTYRVSAVRTAYATTIACQKTYYEKIIRLSTSDSSGEIPPNITMWFKSCLDDKSIYEAIKVLKQASLDKFPEVRYAATTLASSLAPMLILSSSSSISMNNNNNNTSGGNATTGIIEQLSCLDEVIVLANKNLDDDTPAVANGWAEALARCICVAIQYNQQTRADTGSSSGGGSSNDDGGGKNTGIDADGSSGGLPGRGNTNTNRKGQSSITLQLTTLPKAVLYLVDQYIRAGGELALPTKNSSSSSSGSTYSIGGRATRLGYSICLIKLLQIQRNEIGESRNVTIRQVVQGVLTMVNDNVDTSFKQPSVQELQSSVTVTATSFFGTSSKTWCRSDGSIALLTCVRVLRQGLSIMSSEPMQITILQELLHFLPTTSSSADTNTNTTTRELNPSQLQVLLIEISHLIASLRAIASSRIEEAISKLQICLCHANHGVRLEAAIALTSIGSVFPNEGRKLIDTYLSDIDQKHLVSLQDIIVSANAAKNKKKESTDTASSATSRGLGMFRRGIATTSTDDDKKPQKIETLSRPDQYAIHGKVIYISSMMKILATLPDGVQVDNITVALNIATKLESLQFDDNLASASASIMISCIRAGFCIISGILTTGPDCVTIHMESILQMWQKACDVTKNGTKHWSAKYDLHSLDAIVTSIVVFLKYCSELLLTIPEALSNVTMMLEDMFQLVQPTGRFGSLSPSIQLMARLESAKSSLFETFAWLPSGSFPVLADSVFDISVDHIRQSIEDNVATSILPSLISMEDAILDTKTIARAKREGETMGATDIEESIITLTGEPAIHGERESVMLLRSDGMNRQNQFFTTTETSSSSCNDGNNNNKCSFRDSNILHLFASDMNTIETYPTPLHTVGTWRRPLDPSCCSRVRLVDAAIQAFASTFGLKDGHEQNKAMTILASLVPSALSRSSATNVSGMDQDKRSKGGEDSAAIVNITAVLVTCLKALPIHESTHNIPIGLGPPWMNRAKDLFLTFLPVGSSTVRRAVAEGLSLLATLGVTEDAHFLQSSVLHSLDEVMRNNKPDAKSKGMIPEFASSARAGSLLTLACIQRTSFNVKQKQLARARGRVTGSYTETLVDAAHNNLPVLQMMTRILPSVSVYGFKDFFLVKTYALHSYSILLAYANRSTTLTDEDKQLLLKGIELVEDNFVASWTIASVDIDRGQEAEKMATEVAFNAVLLRLMTFLIPFLHVFCEEDPDIARRFSIMATLILECQESHPAITVEAMAFFEVLCGHQDLLAMPVSSVKYSENPLFSCIPIISTLLQSVRPGLVTRSQRHASYRQASGVCLRSTVFLLKALTDSGITITAWSDLKVVALLLSTLESVCSSRTFSNCNLLRSVTSSRISELSFYSSTFLEAEIFGTIRTILENERLFFPANYDRFLRWVLFSRDLFAGGVSKSMQDEIVFDASGIVTAAISVAATDTQTIYEVANPSCSSVKCIAAQIASTALTELHDLSRANPTSIESISQFNLTEAIKECSTRCTAASELKAAIPSSMLVLHLEEVLSSACMSCISTIDQTDVFPLQECAIYFLSKIIECFGPCPDPENPQLSILEQYSTQIFSSIRHALSSADGSISTSTSRLVLAGCKAMSCCVEAKIVTDPAALRRLLRPIVPKETDTPYFGLEGPIRKVQNGHVTTSEENTAQTLIMCAKLWAVGNLLIGNELTVAISDELIKNKCNVAANLAAAAIDGARILYGSGLSLDGKTLNVNDARRSVPAESGYYYAKLSGVDGCLKDLLTSNWATFANRGMQPLLAELTMTTDNDDKELSLTLWVKSLIALLFAGTEDCLIGLCSDTTEAAGIRQITSCTTLTECLGGVALACIRKGDIINSDFGTALSSLIDLLHRNLIVPILSQKVSSDRDNASLSFDANVVSKSCSFLCIVAEMNNNNNDVESTVLLSILKQLHIFQQHPEIVGTSPADRVVAASLRGMSSLIKNGKGTSDLTRAMSKLVVESAAKCQSLHANTVLDGLKMLLKVCLENGDIPTTNGREIACQLAVTKSWEIWSEVGTINDGLLIIDSLTVIQSILDNPIEKLSHSDVLKSILNVLQPTTSDGTKKVSTKIFNGLSTGILSLLYLYGTNKIDAGTNIQRTLICADSIKLCLLALQHVVSNKDVDTVTALLTVYFQSFVAVIRYNGLPNHPSPESGDPNLGRVCAQAILHIARTTPDSFKACVASLSDIERALLEFSVRGEMTGYVVTQQAPIKKKLNLAGFKK